MTVIQQDPHIRFHRLIEVDPASGCWLWAGALLRNGYGKFGVFDAGRWRTEMAHRAAWKLFRGPIPDGMQILHACDVPRCVNPDHLSVGTQAENLADSRAKGRYMSARRIDGYRRASPKISAANRRRFGTPPHRFDEFAEHHGEPT